MGDGTWRCDSIEKWVLMWPFTAPCHVGGSEAIFAV